MQLHGSPDGRIGGERFTGASAGPKVHERNRTCALPGFGYVFRSTTAPTSAPCTSPPARSSDRRPPWAASSVSPGGVQRSWSQWVPTEAMT
jgi:hypothetical protein